MIEVYFIYKGGVVDFLADEWECAYTAFYVRCPAGTAIDGAPPSRTPGQLRIAEGGRFVAEGWVWWGGIDEDVEVEFPRPTTVLD